MVFFFTCINPEYVIYMGKDKYENEDLIKYGLPTDIWFHVDNLSSAHVYLRLPEGKTIDDIPEDVLIDCMQLVKQNSIVGCKQNNVSIVYTPWSNLKKRPSYEVGQVGFVKERDVRKGKVEKKCNAIINRLERTRVESYPNLEEQRAEYDAKIRRESRQAVQEQQRQVKEARREAERLADLRSYKDIMVEDAMTSNKEIAKSVQDYEDDFM